MVRQSGTLELLEPTTGEEPSKRAGRKGPGAASEPVDRLEHLESALLSLLQEVQALRAQAQKQARETGGVEPLLNAQEVGQILGFDTNYVYAMARDGKIPTVRIGKYLRFVPRQLQKWLERRNIP